MAVVNGSAANGINLAASNPYDASSGQSNLRNGVTDTGYGIATSATAAPVAPGLPGEPPGGMGAWGWDILDLGGRHAQNEQAWKRYNAERQAYEYALNQWREDHAIQRKMADLKAAGLNPLLAAGGLASGEQTSATTTKSVNDTSNNHGGALGAILAAVIKAIAH